MAPREVPGGGKVAVLGDPAGSPIGLYQMAKK
jgi:predicted enzyme related to lactoylglutathione lyase